MNLMNAGEQTCSCASDADGGCVPNQVNDPGGNSNKGECPGKSLALLHIHERKQHTHFLPADVLDHQQIILVKQRNASNPVIKANSFGCNLIH